MALTGIHVLCANVASKSNTDLAANFVWSETLASAGTTTNAVPTNTGGSRIVLIISAAVDAYVSVRQSPDAAVSPRMYVRAGTTEQVYPNDGDKLAWVAA